jgi:NADH dehydrogenase
MRVVVLGCGFGGVEVARTLRAGSKELEIVMIDRKTRFDYQPAYPELLSGKVTPEAISRDLTAFARKLHAEFILAEVLGVDFAAKTVKLKTNSNSAASTTTSPRNEAKVQAITYDFLVLAIGAEQTFFNIPGAAEHSCLINTLSAALETRKALDDLDYSRELTIPVIGAGLTGVEVAGELLDYFRARNAGACIYLVEMMPRILPAFPREKIADYVSTFLTTRGVTILTGTAVQNVSEREVTFKDGRALSYDLLIWTAGIKPTSLLDQLDLPKVNGWVQADSYLRVKGTSDVFVVGDTVYFEHNGIRSGQNVEEAEEQGKAAAKNILHALDGTALQEYRPKNTAQNPRALISLGSGKAVVYSGRFMTTLLAYRVKKWVERRYLRRFG